MLHQCSSQSYVFSNNVFTTAELNMKYINIKAKAVGLFKYPE
jgi:hypothetical protein